MLASSASKGAPPFSSLSFTSHHSAETKRMRSFSRSTSSLEATLCTRPAEVPWAIFFHKSGETW